MYQVGQRALSSVFICLFIYLFIFVVRYLMFGVNILFWILGFLIAAIGIYAWIEKDTFDNFGRLTMGGTLFFDPALVFVLVGVFMFCIGFAGCVGSLRENTCLLLFVNIDSDCFKNLNLMYYFSSVLLLQSYSLLN